MTTILLCLVAVATAIAIWAATLYFGRCEELEHHRSTERPNSNDDEASALAWKHKDWELERQRMRTGLTGLVAYGIGMSAAIPANSMLQAADSTSNLPIVRIGVLSLRLLGISLRLMPFTCDCGLLQRLPRRKDTVAARQRSIWFSSNRALYA